MGSRLPPLQIETRALADVLMVFQPASLVSVSLPALLNHPDASGNLSGTKLCFCPRTSAAGSGGRWLGSGWGLLGGPPYAIMGGGGSLTFSLHNQSKSSCVSTAAASSWPNFLHLGVGATPNTPPPSHVTSPTSPPPPAKYKQTNKQTQKKTTHHVCLKDRLEGFLPPPLLKDGCWPDNTSPPLLTGVVGGGGRDGAGSSFSSLLFLAAAKALLDQSKPTDPLPSRLFFLLLLLLFL